MKSSAAARRTRLRDPVSRLKVVSWVKDQWNNTIELGRRDGVPLDGFPRRLARELGVDELLHL
jgi:hypothetical protein